jgi:hypothetical protein
MKWFVREGDESKGPFELPELEAQVRAGTLKPTALVRREDQSVWVEVLSALTSGAAPAPIAPEAPAAAPAPAPAKRSWLPSRTFLLIVGSIVAVLWYISDRGSRALYDVYLWRSAGNGYYEICSRRALHSCRLYEGSIDTTPLLRQRASRSTPTARWAWRRTTRR